MFSRSPAAARPSIQDVKSLDAYRTAHHEEPRAAAPYASQAFAGAPAQSAAPASQPAPTPVASGFALGSIIGNDLTIVGQGLRIITKGTLQVDGKVEGDVVGREVIVGERGAVTGVVSAESVVVRGQVLGTIRGLMVMLHSGAHVEGDVHHHQLAIEEGAHLDGRVRRPRDASELTPDFTPTIATAA